MCPSKGHWLPFLFSHKLGSNFTQTEVWCLGTVFGSELGTSHPPDFVTHQPMMTCNQKPTNDKVDINTYRQLVEP